MVRAAALMPAISASASARPSRAATASWSCSARTSPGPAASGGAAPPGRPGSPRRPRAARRRRPRPARHRPPRPPTRGRGRPAGRPRPSFRLGSSRKATSPCSAWRSSTRSATAGPASAFDRRRQRRPRSVGQLGRQRGLAGQVAHGQQRRGRVEVVGGQPQRLLDRAHGVAELQLGVPDRVPELLADAGRHRAALVEQHDVEVAGRSQLAPARTRRPRRGRAVQACSGGGLLEQRRPATRPSGRTAPRQNRAPRSGRVDQQRLPSGHGIRHPTALSGLQACGRPPRSDPTRPRTAARRPGRGRAPAAR